MSRCFWNPLHSRNATDPPSEGDCANDATILVGASGRWELCASCAALPIFVDSRLKQTPILTTEQRVAQLTAMTWKEHLRESLEMAKETPMPSGVGSARARVVFGLFEHLLNDTRAEAALLRAVKKSAK